MAKTLPQADFIGYGMLHRSNLACKELDFDQEGSGEWIADKGSAQELGRVARESFCRIIMVRRVDTLGDRIFFHRGAQNLKTRVHHLSRVK